jgi:hypothetical protein
VVTDGDPVVREHWATSTAISSSRTWPAKQYKLSAASDGENAKRVGDKLKSMR